MFTQAYFPLRLPRFCFPLLRHIGGLDHQCQVLKRTKVAFFLLSFHRAVGLSQWNTGEKTDLDQKKFMLQVQSFCLPGERIRKIEPPLSEPQLPHL